jgi:ferredoxin
MSYRVVIDKQSCQSSGNCIEVDSEAFVFDDDGLADATPRASGRDLETLLTAASRCPALAIAIFDEAGAEVSG